MTDLRALSDGPPPRWAGWKPKLPEGTGWKPLQDGTGWKPVLLSLDVSVFRRPAAIDVVRRVCHSGVELACLDAAAISRESLFEVGFDTLIARLARLPRADAEPDGFFVLAGQAEGRDWRLSGQIHELGERVWRVDLRGECAFSAIDEILRMLGWPQTQVVFELVRMGLTLGEDDFCRWIAR